MWWQYLIMAIISISAALIAVHFDHWLSGKREYRKAINAVKLEVTVNIGICKSNCQIIDHDLNALKEGKIIVKPYSAFRELAWNTWKSVILIKNPNLANTLELAYFLIPIVNDFLRRIEELKWGPVAVIVDIKAREERNLEEAKKVLVEEEGLLPQLNKAKELLEKEG